MRENTPTSNVSGRRPRHPSGGMIAVNSWCSKVPATPAREEPVESRDIPRQRTQIRDRAARATGRSGRGGGFTAGFRSLRRRCASLGRLCARARELDWVEEPGAGDVLGPAFLRTSERIASFASQLSAGRTGTPKAGPAATSLVTINPKTGLRVTGRRRLGRLRRRS